MSSSEDVDTFLTGSKFYGTSNHLGMQNYGYYIYPDGTRYTGYFRNNKFHGPGHIGLPHPYNIDLSVMHNEGKLTNILKTTFKDELRVEYEFENGQISFKNWNYCRGQDRRLQAERLNSLQPVGQTKLCRMLNELPDNVFDVGFAQFNDDGFLVNMPRHMTDKKRVYVGSKSLRHWIRENCPHGQLLGEHIMKQEVVAKVAREIMRNNLDAEAMPKPARPTASCRSSNSTPSSLYAKTRLDPRSNSNSYNSFLERTVKQGA